MKKDKSPNYIKIGIFTIITTFCWIFFSAYRTLTTKPSPTLSEQILASFNPSLDLSKIDEIQGRIFFEEGQTQSVVNQVPTPEATATPEVTPTPLEEIITPSPTPTETPQGATTSGEVSQ